MAEKALYGNDLEPAFPFEAVAPRLEWLSSVLSNAADDTRLRLLDTILVFSRARTSMMHDRSKLAECKSMMLRLNSVLEDIGGDSLHHRMELVERGDVFFITCKNSPRFNWKTHLTYLEVGQNLDYASAGHVFFPPIPPRGWNIFVERHSMKDLFAESFLVDFLDDADGKHKLMDFNLQKEKMFNEVMEKFGIGYRVKWFMVTPSMAMDAAMVMEKEDPPSAKWWEDNCIFVSGNGIGPMPPLARFISFNVKFVPYWGLIRHMYIFIQKYESVVSQDPAHYLDGLSDVYHSVRRLYDDVQTQLEREMPGEEFVNFFEHVVEITTGLLQELDRRISRGEVKLLRIPNSRLRHAWKRLRWLPKAIRENIRVHLFYRWKLRKPLTNVIVPPAPCSLGHLPLF